MLLDIYSLLIDIVAARKFRNASGLYHRAGEATRIEINRCVMYLFGQASRRSSNYQQIIRNPKSFGLNDDEMSAFEAGRDASGCYQ